jgi:hypothetical protein
MLKLPSSCHSPYAGPKRVNLSCDHRCLTYRYLSEFLARLRAVEAKYAPWDSRTSYLHQLLDVIAYFAKQLFEPNRRLREKGTHNYFYRLAPINLLLKQQGTSIWMV